MSAAAIITLRQKQLIGRFRDAGATSPRTARSLDDLGLSSHRIFRRMARHGVFVAAPPDRWYLDLEALAQYERRQWRWFMIIMVICALTLIALLSLR
ncbi:MAG: hypothetical protein SF069_11590 [Phycisphaerae bacterium]|nr:hypothetical protein [Phycisphaerae bacterium]